MLNNYNLKILLQKFFLFLFFQPVFTFFHNPQKKIIEYHDKKWKENDIGPFFFNIVNNAFLRLLI